ncbi:hypothetical protein ABE29_19100 [Cytobacillus firmus]|uniref:hypothetical protein n=1 Tax=Cytobacillus firmus TaxID=1399 RepID=UPI000E202BC0|nr:hypothetical protein [Cytobacillus firmus]MBG9544797.1 hypothetical protein [Cytobacillus firmus]
MKKTLKDERSRSSFSVYTHYFLRAYYFHEFIPFVHNTTIELYKPFHKGIGLLAPELSLLIFAGKTTT